MYLLHLDCIFLVKTRLLAQNKTVILLCHTIPCSLPQTRNRNKSQLKKNKNLYPFIQHYILREAKVDVKCTFFNAESLLSMLAGDRKALSKIVIASFHLFGVLWKQCPEFLKQITYIQQKLHSTCPLNVMQAKKIPIFAFLNFFSQI